MAGFEDRLRTELERIARPGSTDGVLDQIRRRRVRRAVVQRVQAGTLAIAVLAGTIGGTFGLVRLFSGRPDRPGQAARNGLVAFVRDTKDSGLVTIDPTTGHEATILEGEGVITGPEWSPDGEFLAFSLRTSDGDRGPGIYVVRADGTEFRRVSPQGTVGFSPTWSPDGENLAFSLETQRGSEIFVAGMDGTGLAQLTDMGDAGWPDWSPDGERIAFVGPGPADSPDGWDLYVMNAAGGPPENITDHPAIDLAPDWSPDGTRIVFESRRPHLPDVPIVEGNGPGDIFAVAPDGSQLVRLTDDVSHESAPAWSPDGLRVAFVRGEPDGSSVFVMEAGGTDAHLLASDAYDPAWGVASVAPAPTGTATGTATPTGAEPTPCAESYGAGDFDGDGVLDRATMFSLDCSGPMDQWQYSVEVTWAGSTGSWPVPGCSQACQVLGGSDVDADGRDELAIRLLGFSISDVAFYAVTPDEGLVGIPVGPPGDPEGGFEAGSLPVFSSGGDAFWSYSVGCTDGADGRALVARQAESIPHDSPDAEWHVRETVLRLVGGGPSASATDLRFEFVSARSFTLPFGSAEADELLGHERLCASAWESGEPADPTDPPPVSPVLGTPVEELCDVSTVAADFDGNGTTDRIWTAHDRPATGCASSGNPFSDGYELAGAWDTAGGWWGMEDCVEICSVAAATDLDRDGVWELLVVVRRGASTDTLRLYSILATEVGPVPVTVAAPGSSRFPTGQPADLAAGGGTTHLNTLHCRIADDGVPELTVVAGRNDNFDDAGDMWFIHETVLRYRGVTPATNERAPRFVVVSERDIEMPGGPEAEEYLHRWELCGAIPGESVGG